MEVIIKDNHLVGVSRRREHPVNIVRETEALCNSNPIRILMAAEVPGLSASLRKWAQRRGQKRVKSTGPNKLQNILRT